MSSYPSCRRPRIPGTRRHPVRSFAAVIALALGSAGAVFAAASPPVWVGTWASAQQLTEERNLPPAPGLDGNTLRQVIRVSIGGDRLQIRFSNAFGNAPLHIASAHVARAVKPGTSDIVPETDRALSFQGAAEVTIPVGALVVSDPFDFPLRALDDLAVTLRLQDAPEAVTGHPGSRTTSFLQAGDAVVAPGLPAAAPVEHWYFLSGVEVATDGSPAALAVLGDSITDGRGSTTNGNDRWPDRLSERLRQTPDTAQVGVLNLGIGGNRLLRDGIGPHALARLDRDVLAQPGVRWLIVFEGINDLGTAAAARAAGQPAATAPELIAALDQIIERARARGLRVFGGTILPYGGCFYFSEQGEADRQTVNDWIRKSGRFDAVIDFDAAIRDPQNPSRLAPAFDSGDQLHLNPEGYRAMAAAVDLGLFQREAAQVPMPQAAGF